MGLSLPKSNLIFLKKCLDKWVHFTCVKNNVTITDDVTVGAGAAVVKDITEAGVYVGVPARRMR